MQMVVTDQYMQKMEKELTEVRQRVVRIETAMQKFLSQSTDMAKNARMEKEKGKKDEKNNGSLVTALGRLREEGNRIGEQLGKAADHAISKIRGCFCRFPEKWQAGLFRCRQDTENRSREHGDDSNQIASGDGTDEMAGI